jgi:hypothetical protein
MTDARIKQKPQKKLSHVLRSLARETLRIEPLQIAFH